MARLGIVATLDRIDGFEDWTDVTSFAHKDFDNDTHIMTGSQTRGIGVNILQNNTLEQSYTFGGTQSYKEFSPLMLYNTTNNIAEKTDNNIENIYIIANTTSATLYERDGDIIRNFGQSDIWCSMIPLAV